MLTDVSTTLAVVIFNSVQQSTPTVFLRTLLTRTIYIYKHVTRCSTVTFSTSTVMTENHDCHFSWLQKKPQHARCVHGTKTCVAQLPGKWSKPRVRPWWSDTSSGQPSISLNMSSIPLGISSFSLLWKEKEWKGILSIDAHASLLLHPCHGVQYNVYCAV